MCLQQLGRKVTWDTHRKNYNRLTLEAKNQNVNKEILNLQENHKSQQLSKGAFW